MDKKITVADIIKVTNGKLLYGNKNEVCDSFSKNTKEINKDDTYIGFKGEKNDGGKFYKEAFFNGAKGCIINKIDGLEIEEVEGKFLIEVEDTVDAIGKIAKFKREKYDIPVIAVTGSVGKTSTKDIIYSVLSQKYKTLKTKGNMNNHIGMPMTILGLKEEHEALVVEMGMNHLGEISKLSRIAQPTIAIITNVGTAHIGNLGSRENILKAKLEILEGLKRNGYLIINNENDLLHNWLENIKKGNIKEEKLNKINIGEENIVTFGIDDDSTNVAKDIKYKEDKTKYILYPDKEKIEVPIGGIAFVYNSLAAISVGKILNISMNDIKKGIKEFELSKMRLEVLKSNRDFKIIKDCYNANYDSVKSAIEFLEETKGKRKIAILGDMLELGKFSKKMHDEVGKLILKTNIDVIVTVGKESKNIIKTINENKKEKNKTIETYEFNNNNEAIEKIKQIVKKDDVLLIKASNSMNFSEIADALKNY